MPILTGQLAPDGAVVDVLVALSTPRANALRALNQSVPNPVQLRALIDTGASVTCIEAQAIQPLGLSPTGTIPVVTPSTGSTPAVCNQYDVSLTIIHPSVNLMIPAMPIVECGYLSPVFQGLIGRDTLAHCLFVYDGQAGRYSLAF